MAGNVMIIDDSPVDRKIIRQVLVRRLPEVNLFEAEDGMELQEKLVSNKIHMCILDIKMPQKDGFEVLKEIKENPILMDLPIIVCTGIEDQKAIEQALSLGAYDYFSKPFSEEAIKISLPLKVQNAINLMQRRKKIIYLSYHDELTGLYNRRFCEEEMKRLDTKTNLPISIILGDVNGLKLTNDAFGHEAGDRLLMKIANIIKKECRSDDIIGRVGGDEFLILLTNTQVADAKKIVNRIMEQCEIEKEELIKPSISLGVSTKEFQNQDIMMVYKTAEDQMYNTKLVESKNVRSSIIETLRKNLHEHSYETNARSDRLRILVDKLGKALGLSIEQINNLKLLSLFHDIGMNAMPACILQKGIGTTREEENLMRQHCEIGYRIASSLSDIAYISDDILSHHERWDGNGYPQGLAGEEIPFNARILAVLDTYDLMVNGSFYQRTVSKQEALEFIKKQAGKSFDPKIVDAFIRVMNMSSIKKKMLFKQEEKRPHNLML